MAETLTLTEIANTLDTLANVMVNDSADELAGCNASFWRDAAAYLRRVETGSSEETLNDEPLG